MMGSHDGNILRNHITELYSGTALRNHSTESYYEIIIMRGFLGIPFEASRVPWDPPVTLGVGRWDPPGTPVEPTGDPRGPP